MNAIYDENGYIDLIESQKRRFSKEEITKDDIKKILINCGSIVIGESMLYNCFLDNVPFTIIPHIILLGVGNVNIYQTLFKKTRESEIIKLIEESEQYNDYKKLYEDYLKNLVSFLKSINITSSLDISRFYSNFLESGFFSATTEHEWKTPKYSKESYIPKMLGSCIICGYGVCRHAASMLTDILNAAEIPPCNLNVTAYDIAKYQKSPIKILNLRLTNHLITGIIENNEKYTYDPTYQTYSIYSEETAKRLGFNPDRFLISEDNKNFYQITSIIDFLHESFNRKGEMSYDSYSSYPSKIITTTASDESYDNLIENTEKNINKLKDFRQEQLPNLQKIKSNNFPIFRRENNRMENKIRH